MILPPTIQRLIAQARITVRDHPEHALRPFARLVLYDACGPTFAAASHTERLQILAQGTIPWTHADRVRARLAILTARHGMPLWLPTLAAAGLLHPAVMDESLWATLSDLVRWHVPAEQQPRFEALLARPPVDDARLQTQILALDPQQIHPGPLALMQETVTIAMRGSTAGWAHVLELPLDAHLVAVRSVFSLPTYQIPRHLLHMAEGVLQGTVNPRVALEQCDAMHTSLGNFLGYAEEAFPARAYDICAAAYEALRQALGLGPYDGLAITPGTTDASLRGEGAAAAAALKAVSGVCVGTISTEDYDHEQQGAFWRWWLTEGIPDAWAAAAGTVELPTTATMPFTQTVRITRYRTGITVDRDDRSPTP